jgi:hypothetical protein
VRTHADNIFSEITDHVTAGNPVRHAQTLPVGIGKLDQEPDFKIVRGRVKAGNLVSNHQLEMASLQKSRVYHFIQGTTESSTLPFILILSPHPDLAIMTGLLINPT